MKGLYGWYEGEEVKDDGVEGMIVGGVINDLFMFCGDIGWCSLEILVELFRLGELLCLWCCCLGFRIEVWMGEVGGNVLLSGFCGVLILLGELEGFFGLSWGEYRMCLELFIFGMDWVCEIGGVRLWVEWDWEWFERGDVVWGWYGIVVKVVGVYEGEMGEVGLGLVFLWMVGGFWMMLLRLRLGMLLMFVVLFRCNEGIGEGLNFFICFVLGIGFIVVFVFCW